MYHYSHYRYWRKRQILSLFIYQTHNPFRTLERPIFLKFSFYQNKIFPQIKKSTTEKRLESDIEVFQNNS